MFVQVTHMDIAADNWQEAVRRFRSEIVYVLEKRPGFLRTILTGDVDAGKATVITMWRSAEHVEQQDPVVEHMKGLVSEDPQTSGYPELFEREF